MNPVQLLLGKAGKWAIDKTPDVMKQDDRWNNRYNEVKAFIEEHHRNPSKYVGEERNMYSFVKHCRKLMNQGLLKEERVEAFKGLLEVIERYKRVNQYQ